MSANVIKYPPDGALKFLDYVHVGSPVSSYDIVGIPSGYDELFVRMQNPFNGQLVMTVQPEGLSSNQTSMWSFQDWGAALSQLTQTDLQWIGSGPDGGDYRGTFTLQLRTGGIRRTFEQDSASYDRTNNRALRAAFTKSGYWNNTTTPVTYARLNCSSGSIAVGAEIKAWAIKY